MAWRKAPRPTRSRGRAEDLTSSGSPRCYVLVVVLRTWGLAAAIFLIAASARAEPLPLRVLSWNVWGLPGVSDDREARMSRIGPGIASYHPDLVALQEVWADEDAASIGDALRSSGLGFQEKLSSSRPGATGNAGLLVASRYPIRGIVFHPFPQGTLPHTPWHLDWMSAKGVLQVTVETPLGDLRFADTHLQASYATSDYLSVRLAQALEIAHLLRSPGEGGKRDAVLLAGDFNTGPTELPFRALVAGADLTPTTLDFAIDTVLYRPGDTIAIRATHLKTVLEEPVALGDGRLIPLSDHPAIVADFELTPSDARTSSPFEDGSEEVFSQARDTLRGDRLFARRVVFLARAVGLSLLPLSLAALRRSRRSAPGRKRRAWIVGASVMLLVAAWSLYLGLAQAPSQLAGLRRAAALLERKPAVVHAP